MRINYSAHSSQTQCLGVKEMPIYIHSFVFYVHQQRYVFSLAAVTSVHFNVPVIVYGNVLNCTQKNCNVQSRPNRRRTPAGTDKVRPVRSG